MTPRSTFTLAGCLLAMSGELLAAQGEEPRAALLQWNDSLMQMVDAGTVRAIYRTTRVVSDSMRSHPVAAIRWGSSALRLAELDQDARPVSEAGRVFRAIAMSYPDWQMAWTGLGHATLAEARAGLSAGDAISRIFGFDPHAAIVEHFIRGAGPDSTWFDGIAQLANRALRSRVELDEIVALRTLRLLPERVIVTNPQAALLRARLEREAGEKDSALAVVERAAELHSDHPLILRLLAQMRFVVGAVNGSEPWYRGLTLADDEAMARYQRDLQMIIPDSTMARLFAVPPRQRADLVRNFWRSQDPDGLPTHDDRLAEHYRRLEFARHNYVRTTVERAVRLFEFDTLGIAAFDARGEMMLRHGSPRIRTSIGDHGGPNVEVTLRVVGMPPNESWAYARTDGEDQFYHFVKPAPDQDFIAVESILDILAQSAQFKRFRPGAAPWTPGDTTRRTVLVHGAELVSMFAQELLASRQEMSPIYRAMIDEGMDSADSTQQVERSIGRASLARPFSYELGFELPLDAAVDARSIGSDRYGPVLQVAYAIRSSGVSPRSAGRGYLYPIRLRVAVLDADGAIVAQVDTVRNLTSVTRLASTEDLLGYLPIRVPPGTHRVRVALESDRRGFLFAPQMVHVASPETALSLSDIAIGARSVPILWQSPTADTAWANPRGRYRANEELELYFEIGGLEAGTSYRTQIAIDRVEKGQAASCAARGSALTLSFDGEHPGRVVREQRAVALDRLQPADYLMAVTITTEAGERTTRCRGFTVVRR